MKDQDRKPKRKHHTPREFKRLKARTNREIREFYGYYNPAQLEA